MQNYDCYTLSAWFDHQEQREDGVRCSLRCLGFWPNSGVATALVCALLRPEVHGQRYPDGPESPDFLKGG
jgi:hypothetical protein